MRMLKTIFGNALVLATLLTAIGGGILVAHADRQPEPESQISALASQAKEEKESSHGGWMDFPRGSFIDAML